MREDLVGKHFGLLTVIGFNEETRKWICKCDCGKTTEVKGYNLKQGNTKSCGHLKSGKGTTKHREISILKQQIGQLYVTDINKNKNEATVRCLKCGRVSKMPLDKLIEMKKTRKKTYTCGLDGCSYKGDKMTAANIKNGTKFGDLIVLERLPNRTMVSKNSRTSIPMYLCRCECGNEVEVQGRYLIDGRTKSCGHLRKKNFIDKITRGGITASSSGKKLYEIYMGWQQKYRQPTKTFKTKVIDKGIKFFPELKDSEDPFKSFMSWALINYFSIKEGNIYLERKDYNKDFSISNCFWTTIKTRGY